MCADLHQLGGIVHTVNLGRNACATSPFTHNHFFVISFFWKEPKVRQLEFPAFAPSGGAA